MVTHTEDPQKPSKKPLIYYYILAMIVLLLLNALLFPSLLQKQVVEVPYNQFLDMVDEGKVKEVALDDADGQLVFVAEGENGREGYYKTGIWPDDGQRLLQQLRESEPAIQFEAEIPTQASPIMTFLVSWVLPIVFFIFIGELLSRQMMKRMGGGLPGNAMTFGKSGAKIYAETETGVTFADVAGEEEAKEALTEIVDFLHDPEKYRSDVEKIIASGKTPAGMHIPIMVDEILDVLQIRPGQTGYDATLGYGGHTRKLLEQLQGQGHLYATDVDPIEMEKTRARLAAAGYGPELLTIQHRNFADVDQVAPGVLFDFVLADLGVSSMQIDDPARGFTFKQDGPLDLRLDPTSGVTAAERLRQLTQEELEDLLAENADEPYADRIARAICQVFRRGGTVDTTRQLYALIEGALSFLPAGERKEAVKKSCQRTFQALRIDVNSEFEVLYAFLDKLPHVLKPGGRAAILTFHSGEDRLVKQAFRQQYRDGLYRDIAQEVTRPSPQECRRNPRAHSTKLRWAVRAE